MPVNGNDNDWLAAPTTEDRNRIDAVWRALCDRPESTMISPANRMDIWVIEQRLKAERLATDRLARASNALVWATVVLAAATIALVIVTLVAAK